MPIPFSALALVFVGGGLGSVARYLVGAASLRLMGPNYPWGTLAVNIVGSAVMGVLSALIFARFMPVEARDPFRLLLMTGLLGGFTTFSAFSLDLYTLVERGDLPAALLYGIASVLVSLAALVGGVAVTRALVG